MMEPGKLLILFITACTALAMAAYLPGVRRAQGHPRLRLARMAVYINAGALLAAAAYLWYLIISHQYQYDYVFRYSSNDMPFRYVFASFWGGQEGTFLLWAVFGGLLSLVLRARAKQYEAPVQFFYLGINLFLMFMLIKASPFSRLPVIPPDGNGLNPLLQDPWMTIHPPVMFFGFASLGIPAAYAMAAMVKEDWDNWVRRAIPWTTFGIVALGTGLVMGGYWAYSILGWGGFWGWDPVENSSLVPWLVAIALLHNQVIQQKCGIFRRSNLFLAMMPFLLLTYSTFLTRSGVLADFSVHSFTDLGINQFLAAFMGVFFFGGMALFLLKFRRIPVDKAQAPLFSREYFMFLGALSFGLFAIFVALGTSAPLISRLWDTPSNVQPEFYNRMGLPFAVLISLLMGIGPFLLWNQSSVREMIRGASIPAGLTVIAGVGFFFAGVREPQYLLMALGAVFATLANAVVMVQVMRRNRAAVGGYLAHVGIGLAVLGILTSTVYDEAETVVLPKGEEVLALGYGFTYMGTREVEEGRKNAYDVGLRTANGNAIISPTMFFSDFTRGMMKKPGIKMFFSRDVYVAPIAHAFDPIEDRVETRASLIKKQPTMVEGVPLTLVRLERGAAKVAEPEAAAGSAYDNDTPASSGTATDVTAEIRVPGPEGDVTLQAVMRVLPDGYTEVIPVPVPGTGLTLRLLAVDGTGSRVQVGVQRAPLALGRHETLVVDGATIAFHDFDVVMPSKQGGTVRVFATTDVTIGSETYTVRPGLVSRPGADKYELIEAPLGKTGLNLVLQQVDSASGTAFFYLAPKPQEYFYAEASTKPFIGLLWLGTVLTLAGLTTATWHRGRLADRIKAAVAGEREGAKNGKREAA